MIEVGKLRTKRNLINAFLLHSFIVKSDSMPIVMYVHFVMNYGFLNYASIQMNGEMI